MVISAKKRVFETEIAPFLGDILEENRQAWRHVRRRACWSVPGAVILYQLLSKWVFGLGTGPAIILGLILLVAVIFWCGSPQWEFRAKFERFILDAALKPHPELKFEPRPDISATPLADLDAMGMIRRLKSGVEDHISGHRRSEKADVTFDFAQAKIWREVQRGKSTRRIELFTGFLIKIQGLAPLDDELQLAKNWNSRLSEPLDSPHWRYDVTPEVEATARHDNETLSLDIIPLLVDTLEDLTEAEQQFFARYSGNTLIVALAENHDPYEVSWTTDLKSIEESFYQASSDIDALLAATDRLADAVNFFEPETGRRRARRTPVSEARAPNAGEPGDQTAEPPWIFRQKQRSAVTRHRDNWQGASPARRGNTIKRRRGWLDNLRSGQ